MSQVAHFFHTIPDRVLQHSQLYRQGRRTEKVVARPCHSSDCISRVQKAWCSIELDGISRRGFTRYLQCIFRRLVCTSFKSTRADNVQRSTILRLSTSKRNIFRRFFAHLFTHHIAFVYSVMCTEGAGVLFRRRRRIRHAKGTQEGCKERERGASGSTHFTRRVGVVAAQPFLLPYCTCSRMGG